MDFEWDGAKEEANRKKHGVDFRTAAKVFLDPYVIEFDDFSVRRGALQRDWPCRRPDALRRLHDEGRHRSPHFRKRSGAA